MKIKTRDLTKVPTLVFFANLFWFLSLYPGRIGADSVALIRMIRNNDSTDWWTSLFYWFVKLSSLNGSQIWITSLTQLLFLYYSGKILIHSLPISNRQKDIATICFVFNPMYGVFGMTIGHDATQTAGIFFLIAIGIRLQFSKIELDRKILTLLFVAFLLLLTTHTGPIFVVAFVISLFFISQRNLGRIALLGACCLLLSVFSSIGVHKYLNVYGRDLPTKDVAYSLLIADIQCVTQIKDASLSQASTEILNSIAPEANWKKASTCANKDLQINELGIQTLSLSSMRREIISVYKEVVAGYPQVVLMAHIQRSRGVLPPPFFQPPDNQVSWNIAEPIGNNTGTALQQGPEVLHPSIDGKEFKSQNKVIKVLESLTQSFVLLINQASWMWGWAGLWLYPVALFVLLKRRSLYKWGQFTICFSPIAVLHLCCFFLIPYSQPRYYMATILLGQLLLAVLIVGKLEKKGLK